MSASASDPIEWRFVQSFGDDNSSDDDLVTAVEFDPTGHFLAVGDKAGRICIFEANQTYAPPPPRYNRHFTSHSPSQSPPSASNHHLSGQQHHQTPSPSPPIEYKFYTEFQSHEPEFDCLKSLEIEEKINMIKWTKSSAAHFMIAANDKTIKLWKIHEKRIKRITKPNRPPGQFVSPSHHNTSSDQIDGITIPKLTVAQSQITATPKRTFSNGHGYHINSISINSDQQTFISADDLRINLWSIERNNESFNLVDIKPNNLEELTEVITSASFHPTQCHSLIYASSRGTIRLADLRDSALCDHHAKLFEVEEDPANKSFFSEIISSISDARFAAYDGRYIISRDYLTVKIWDINMESKPISIIPVHDYLRVHLCDLYENDCIFDRFELSANEDGTRIVSGSYNNHFVLHSTEYQHTTTIEALKDGPKPKLSTSNNNNNNNNSSKPIASNNININNNTNNQNNIINGINNSNQNINNININNNNKMTTNVNNSISNKVNGSHHDHTSGSGGGFGVSAVDIPNVNLMDFGKKSLHVAWHPQANTVAVAGLNKLYIYHGHVQNE